MYTQITVYVADWNIDLNSWHSHPNQVYTKSTHGTLTDLSNNKRKNDEYTNKGVSTNHSVHGALKKSLFRVDSLVALIHHNPIDKKSLILVKDIPREIKNTRKDQQLRLRLY